MNLEILKKILVEGSYIGEDVYFNATTKTDKHVDHVINYLIENNLLTEQLFTQAVSEYYKLPYLDLSTHKPDENTVRKIPETIARNFHVALISSNENEAVLATDNIEKKEELIKNVLPILAPAKITIVYAIKREIEELFLFYKNTLQTRFAEIIKDSKRIAPEIINQIIEDALLLKASDIHFEPQENDVLIRFRIDGILSEVSRLPKKYYENILNKIKVDSSLRIDEHDSAQDGSIRFVKEETKADLRVSILPTIFGEKVVLRVLSYYVGNLSLNELGLSEENQKLVESVSKKPFGMILVTGPTGSGKTTTLYALLKHLQNPTINITTIEDPVEYRIEGINQIQVNEATHLTFAEGLRSIVRQDPDVILVGEIRDKETAETAVNAALTGHLLLSTFHSNDAVTTIPRLLDMGIEPFLLSSTLEAVIAQRLVRRLCSSCKYSEELAEPYFGISTIYKGRGCNACGYTGYHGQIGIFECIEVTDEIENAIISTPDKKSIETILRKSGTKTMFEDGLEKIKHGLTTIEEVSRVIGDNKS